VLAAARVTDSVGEKTLSKKNKIIITLHLIYAVLSIFLLTQLLGLSTAYAPVAVNIERTYYLSTLGELYGSGKIGEGVFKNRNEVQEKGSFHVAERLWALNKDAGLEVIHKRLLLERSEGLKKAPSIEAKARNESIGAWLVINIILYGLSVLVWRTLLRIYRGRSIKSEVPAKKTNPSPNRSKAGWSGKM